EVSGASTTRCSTASAIAISGSVLLGNAEGSGPGLGRGHLRQLVAVALGQLWPLLAEPVVHLHGAPDQVAVVLRVALVERSTGAIGHRDDRRVEARQPVPPRVHRRNLRLGELVGQLSGGPELT